MRQILVLSLLVILGGAGLMAQQVITPAPPAPPSIGYGIPAPPPEPPEAVLPEIDEEYVFAQDTPPEIPSPPEVFHIASGKGGSYLGIGVQEVSADRAKELKLSDVHGVEVTKVEDDSPASRSGLKQGDVVLEYQGQRVEGTAQFVRLVRETPAGRQVKLLISRGGANQSLNATVGERKPKHVMIERNFTMDPKWHEQMEKLQEQLGRMRFQFEMPDLPQPFMSWRSAALGIEAESVSSQLAEFFGVKKGVLVRSVGKDTPAEKAGIKAGDVIVKVDGVEVSTPSEVAKRVRAPEAKKTFPVTVVRNRQEVTLNVTVEDRPSREPRPQHIMTPRPQSFRVRTVDAPASPLL
ncbi:MAG: PDZ domain-containing protein [Bryobacteraceae bacterium]|jgi:C-terminal processing protease CtpA/Prc